MEKDGDSTYRNLRFLFIKSVLSSLGDGMVAPFMSIYPIFLGASPSDMGLINPRQISRSRSSKPSGVGLAILSVGGCQ